MTTGPTTRLTWHQGSVLPYSSLWHTVQRAMSLNALRSKELAFCCRGSDQVGIPRHVNLLYNEAGDGQCGAPVEALSMRSLAQSLGEPEAVFAWAHPRPPAEVGSLAPLPEHSCLQDVPGCGVPQRAALAEAAADLPDSRRRPRRPLQLRGALHRRPGGPAPHKRRLLPVWPDGLLHQPDVPSSDHAAR